MNFKKIMDRKRQIYTDVENKVPLPELIKKWKLSRQRINFIYNEVKKRGFENYEVDTRILNTLKKAGLTLEEAKNRSVKELLTIKQLGPKRINIIKKHS